MSRYLFLIAAVLLSATVLRAEDPNENGVASGPGIPGVAAPGGGKLDGNTPAPVYGLVVVGATPALGKTKWDDPNHKIFFNYQRYLVKIGLEGQTEASWAKLTDDERGKRIVDDETFLKKKLADVVSTGYTSGEDEALVEAVWGKDVLALVKKANTARRNGQQSQIDAAMKAVAAKAAQIGGIKGDWAKIFDGGGGKDEDMKVEVVEKPSKDYLAAKAKENFLDSLKSKEIGAALATQASYEKFLMQHGVSAQALPGMSAMYQVLNSAKDPQKAELAHILPTTVRLLLDGKHVIFDPEGPAGAYGVAKPGPYDQPEAVVVTPAVIGADPVVVGKTLAHEFQHIYDMYTGRYYTLDSEMRGFKTAVLYFEVLKKEHPDKYKELKNSLNDGTREIIRDVEDYTADFHASPQKFHDAVAARYNQREEGVFQGRMSLRESVNPDVESSAVNDLAIARGRREKAKAQVAGLEAQQAKVRAARAKTPTRDLDHELEAVTKDLATWRQQYDHWDQETTIKELRLRRMQSEANWLDANSKGKDPDPYDLTLPVDKKYALP